MNRLIFFCFYYNNRWSNPKVSDNERVNICLSTIGEDNIFLPEGEIVLGPSFVKNLTTKNSELWWLFEY